MAVFDLVTLAELQSCLAINGTGRNAQLRRAITAASRAIENEIGRRLIYRAPPDVATRDNVVASRALAAGAIPVEAITQPAAPGRTLILSIVDPTGVLTGGTVTVVGTVAGAAKTVVFDLANGTLQHGVDFFTAIDSITPAALAGAAEGQLLSMGTSAGYLEYHTMGGACAELLPLEWPIQGVLEVNEDMTRSFESGTALVADDDYLLTRDSGEGGKLIRVYSRQAFPWFGGWRSVKLIHAAGYAGAAAVPDDLKDDCFRLAGLLFYEIDKGRLGISGGSDASGNWTRFGPAKITDEMRSHLGPYYRRRHGTDTGERDWDLEAA